MYKLPAVVGNRRIQGICRVCGSIPYWLHWMHTKHAMHRCIQTYPSCCRCSSLYPSPLPRHSVRSFSTLKRLKTYLRSSVGDERLTSLALIHVHAQTTPIERGEVVDKFALTGPHKLNFLRYSRLSSFCRVVYFFILKCFRLLWVVI